MLLFRISVQLSLEHLIAHARIQLDCFDISVYSQRALCNRTWLKFRKAFCLFHGVFILT